MPHDARDYALRAHGDQAYGPHPYAYHLDAVAALCARQGEPALTIAYLHDTVEDTATTLNDIRRTFGDLVADCVDLLTDPEGPDRKTKKARAYGRLAQVRYPAPPGEAALYWALVVKAADRLANVRESVATGFARKLEMYRGEQPHFREAAYRPGLCDSLWLELDGLLALP